MKFVSRALVALSLLFTPSVATADLREETLRQAALKAGLVPVEQLMPEVSKERAELGRILFEDTRLSLNGGTSCQTCHLDRFASADGLPMGIGVGAEGEGVDRARSGGALIPRNVLPLWGRGAPQFDVFFWDGKVDASNGHVVSQFGGLAPSSDPLVVAVHLPFVEIREMVTDDAVVKDTLMTESVESANAIYVSLMERLREDEKLMQAMAEAFGVPKGDLTFLHVAEAVADFIRFKFQVRQTKLHDFVFAGGPLTPAEMEGGLVFYGKGRCALCHNGPLFSDLRFHAIPLPQYGFGKNGFGIDYGRFNVTFDVADLYKFRTPPLYNVAATAPYSHSGSLYDLRDVIGSHFDPLATVRGDEMTEVERIELYRRIAVWGDENLYQAPLNAAEIDALVAFLSTLSFPGLE